jgi:hypothetical protein
MLATWGLGWVTRFHHHQPLGAKHKVDNQATYRTASNKDETMQLVIDVPINLAARMVDNKRSLINLMG